MQKELFKITSLKDGTQFKEASLVIKQCWQETYQDIFPANQLKDLDERVWQQSLKRPGRHNLIALVNDKIVGIVSYGQPRQTEFFAKDTGELMSIYLLAEYQNNGIGSTLMQTALDNLQNDGFKQACLWVEEQNSSAINFYEHKGWRKTGIHQEQSILGKKVSLVQYKYDFS